jgi:hypothetical protein
MASVNKFTIRVSTAHRTQSMRWSSVGQEGDVNMSQTVGQLLGVPFGDMSASDPYWRGVLASVLAAIPLL